MVEPPGTFRVLMVCTGNICRSPYAERLLRSRLTARLGDDAARVEVTSAGTRALVGESMHAPMVEVLAGYGATGDDFVARQVTQALLRDADVVLTASREHRAAVVSLVPGVLRRAFTLPEFARVVSAVDLQGLPSDPVERLRALVRRAGQIRATVPASRPAEDDVEDPYGGPVEGYHGAGTRIGDAVDRIVAAL